MTTKQLYKHIETLYKNFDFKSKMIIDNLFLIKEDNYYQLSLYISDTNKLQLRISKHYSIIQNTYYILNYEIFTTFKNGTETKSYEIKDKIPKQLIELLLPTIRQFNLNILFNEIDNTQTIFEYSI